MIHQPPLPPRPGAAGRRTGITALTAVLAVVTVLTALTPSALASTSRPAVAARRATVPAAAPARATITRAAAVPAPTPLSVVRLASCRARGKYATCTASGSVSHPRSIYLHVAARRGQRVSGSWITRCSPSARFRLNMGSFRGWASVRHPLRRKLSMYYGDPSSCSALADGQLSHRGRIHVWLTART